MEALENPESDWDNRISSCRGAPIYSQRGQDLKTTYAGIDAPTALPHAIRVQNSLLL